ncbi:MAG: hypothetical protein ABSC25_08260 [Roseiarcus sp.]|jgi:hypothetical protein
MTGLERVDGETGHSLMIAAVDRTRRQRALDCQAATAATRVRRTARLDDNPARVFGA